MTGIIRAGARPVLRPHVRLSFDPRRGRYVLLTPEAVSLLNQTSAAVLGLCDGHRTVAEILTQLRGQYADVADEDVHRLLDHLYSKRWVELHDD